MVVCQKSTKVIKKHCLVKKAIIPLKYTDEIYKVIVYLGGIFYGSLSTSV